MSKLITFYDKTEHINNITNNFKIIFTEVPKYK